LAVGEFDLVWRMAILQSAMQSVVISCISCVTFQSDLFVFDIFVLQFN